ncbi:helix-turn-helix domain-containing protein [Amycolatopsis sp. NBC_01480]|uniref:helix-turn-helix domain-containing protein n=1 Tax=Amycolatopsis sp. NBC_01480 TaxID=2903562 RepID=UPI002E2E3E5E|nr:helix-turn-helix domain-containing protein [Amycolatopsis sp. NBC_01480]
MRLRILRAFLGDRALTTAQLAAELDDVPSGSVDRRAGLLTKAGVLHVVAERRVRGTVERTALCASPSPARRPAPPRSTCNHTMSTTR